MNVISMMHEINVAANSMIGESPLPDFPAATNDSPEFMRVRALDQLNGSLDGHIDCWSQQEMNMFGHHDKRVQIVLALPSMPISRLKEEAYVIFDDKQFPSVPRREGHEVSSRRRDESSRLQSGTSAAGSRASLSTLNWHEWNSCPSRLFFTREFSFWESAL